jgi:NTP pyrophosphatase (non-canonical NTP hydrolase)
MGLTFDDYQHATAQTAVYGDQISKIMEGLQSNNPRQLEVVRGLLKIAYVGLGLGESGEVQNKAKKIFRDDGGQVTDDRRAALIGELGGNLWYISQMCTELGVTMGDVAQANLDVLMSRKERNAIHGDGDNR